MTIPLKKSTTLCCNANPINKPRPPLKAKKLVSDFPNTSVVITATKMINKRKLEINLIKSGTALLSRFELILSQIIELIRICTNVKIAAH